MGQRIKNFMPGLFYLCFGLLFSSLVLRLLGQNSAPPFAPWLAAGALLLLAGIYSLLGRWESWLEKHYLPLLAGFLALSGAVQLASAVLLRYQPAFDLGAIYQGAIEWVEQGSFFSQYSYFYYFPNNLGGMAFLAVFFSIARWVGVTDTFMVASVVNGLCVLGAICATAAVCRRLLGVRHAVFALALFALSLPFWCMAPVFYTDSLSILFPILLYYLYIRLQDCQGLWQRLLLTGLMGVTATVGMLVKFTVAIMLIAILIDSLLRLPLKRTAAMAGLSLLVVAAGFWAFNGMIYAWHLDKDIAQVQNTPKLHWVMMGLQGEGGYNPQDYEFTRSFSDPDQQHQALVDEIGSRMEQLGPDGLYRLFWRKTLRNFGSGTYNQSDFLDDSPVNRGWLQELLLYDGQNYPLYQGLCQSVFLAVLALVALSSLQEVFGGPGRSQRDTARLLAPRVAVFGVLLFFACWETAGRYITNYVPVLLLGAVLGIDTLAAAIKGLPQVLRLRQDKKDPAS